MKEVDFQSLNMKDWAQEEKLAVSAKEKKPISTSCYLCNTKISTFKELKLHMNDPYHLKTVEKFVRSIEVTKSGLIMNPKQ
jgi:hypothetical protein